jgi:TPR repeat protein
LLYEKTQALEARGQMKDAVRVYRQAATAGSGNAAKRLYEHYARPFSPDLDYQEAFNWAIVACNKGINLGRICVGDRR